ncbi:MAG: hypothetical protein Q7T26_12065, partial [Dehalococcoidia bacterium]|nr:hypothetical protein [Dehalococcoidia bacterium]
PGIDDWQFVNRGSYIAPGGHCAGQALTALWYYVNKPDGKEVKLYDRYDNNRLSPATPEIWQDDSYGYRFASVIQKDINWDSFANKLQENLAGVDDELTFKAFAYSMQLTGEPQEVGLFSSKGGGHDMIGYRIKDNQIYIADPNYPGNNDRRIDFVNGKFKPYNSGANKKEIDAGNGTAYETIQYAAKTFTVDWSLIARRWAEVKSGAIGNDRFPKYTLGYVDKDGKVQPLNDGAVISVNPVRVGPREGGFGQVVYRDGQKLNPDASSRLTLVPGENKLGFAIYGKVNEKWEYVDFRYVTVRYQTGDIQPPIARLPGNIYLGAYPYQKEAEMTHGLYLITPNDGKSRQISPRAIQGVAISPDGTKLAAGMLAETGRGPGDPQLAIFDAKDPAYKSLRSVFEVRPGKGPEQLTNPTWARDSLTLAVSRTTDLHLYQYSPDKSKDKTSFWAIWEGNYPAWSPTDNRLVIGGISGNGLYLVDDVMKGAYQFDPKYEIWSQQAEQQGFRSLRPGAVTKIAGAPNNARKPKWSPDGKNILFISEGALWTIPASGGAPARVSPEGWKIGAATYSPDANYIAVVRAEAPANGGVWVLKPNGSEPRQLVKADFSVYGGVDLAWGP